MRDFNDRAHAGRELANRLQQYAHARATLVLALPRGGVPVGFEIAQALQLPLDVLIVRKVGAPGQRELAVGAIASGGAIVWNQELVSLFPTAALEAIVSEEREELARRESLYRGTRQPLDVRNRTVLLVDDGAATGASMRVAIQALRSLSAREILAVLPVASESALECLQAEADRVYCLLTPPLFDAVGKWYRHFPDTTDAQVIAMLRQTRREPEGPSPAGESIS